MALDDGGGAVWLDPVEGDVFNFQWSREAWERAKTRLGHGDLNWAFEGQLICQRRHDGILHLVDTYWGSGVGDSKTFTIEEMRRDGTLTFLCNLNTVEAIPGYDREYFKPSDVFCLHSQHGLQRRYVKRKGAERDRDQMLSVVRQRIGDRVRKAESDARLAMAECARLAVAEYLLEAGDTSVRIPEVSR